MSASCSGFWKAMNEEGKRPFLMTPTQTFSYADLREATLRWLALFDDAGMQGGDRVLIQTGNEFAAITCVIAALIDGKVPVNLASDTPAPRFDAILRSVEPKCVVCDAAMSASKKHTIPCKTFVIEEPQASSQKPRMAALFRRHFERGLAGIPPLAADRDPALPEDDNAIAYILFTSGSTAAPTGVTITHGNLAANLDTISRLFGYGKSSRIFNDMVLAHVDGLAQGPLLALANRCAVIRAGGFELSKVEEWLLQVRTQRATHFITVPTVWAMIDAYAAHDDYFDAPEFRSLQSVAAKLSIDLWDRIEARFGLPIASHYGLTETVASALYAGDGDEMGERGTLGKPVDCEARIDPEATSGEGELQLRGENVFPGYWRNEERTAQSFTEDGWFRTGDLAAPVEDGSYRILGRLKNVIMSGGFLIRPDEIDEAMLRHPAVEESVTVTLDDDTFGEIAATAIVTGAPITLEDLTRHARSHLETMKVPRRIAIVDAIERGDSGKPLINKVRQALLEAGRKGEPNGRLSGKCDIEHSILALAADMFRVPREALSMATAPGDIEGWDSFTQLTLIMEAEQRFSISIPASRVASIADLSDLRDAVSELSS